MDNSLKEWLFNLNCLYNHVFNALNSHINLYRFSDVLGDEMIGDVDAVFITYILVNTNSFIDEWNIRGSEVIQIKRICHPVFEFISKKWPDIKKLRNNVLAHNHRDKGKKSIHFTSSWLGYKVPLGNVEIELLVYLLGLVVEATNKVYKFDYDEIVNVVDNYEVNYNPMGTIEAIKIKEDVRNQMNSMLKSSTK